MKVSLFVHNLSSNPVVRAYPIAKAIESLGYEVEVIGFTINSNKIYEPYKNEFAYKTDRIRLDIKQVFFKAFKLAKQADGDIIFAFKPLWTTLFPALLASGFGIKKRIILDVEDNEFWDVDMHSGFKKFKKCWRNPLNPIYTKILHPLTWIIKRKSVVSFALKKRYGGSIVLHGPLNRNIDFNRYSELKKSAREQLNLPQDKNLLVFAGKPTPYKGLDFLIDVLQDIRLHDWDIILAGDETNEDYLKAKALLNERCHLSGFLPHNKMQLLYLAIDAVPIIQKKNPITKMQIPAKLLEAMSFGKAIISTYVSDIPKILQTEGKNGWLIPYGNKEAFITCLDEIKKTELKEYKIGKNAYNFYLKNASVEEIAKRIRPFFILK